MKLWHVRFGRRLSSELHHVSLPRWTFGQWLAVAARQAGLQASAWLALPLASLIMLPLAWTYAFYQNVDDNPTDVGFFIGKTRRGGTA